MKRILKNAAGILIVVVGLEIMASGHYKSGKYQAEISGPQAVGLGLLVAFVGAQMVWYANRRGPDS